MAETITSNKLISSANNEQNAIPNNCWANVMRVSMENKNLLASKGSLYVGTGETNNITDGAGNTQRICRTKALEPGKMGQVLTVGDNAGTLVWKTSAEVLDAPKAKGKILVTKDVNGTLEWQDFPTLWSPSSNATSKGQLLVSTGVGNAASWLNLPSTSSTNKVLIYNSSGGLTWDSTVERAVNSTYTDVFVTNTDSSPKKIIYRTVDRPFGDEWITFVKESEN